MKSNYMSSLVRYPVMSTSKDCQARDADGLSGHGAYLLPEEPYFLTGVVASILAHALTIRMWPPLEIEKTMKVFSESIMPDFL